MTHTASFWTSPFWTEDTWPSWLAMYLLALPVFFLCALWATAYLLLMGVRWVSESGMRLLERCCE